MVGDIIKQLMRITYRLQLGWGIHDLGWGIHDLGCRLLLLLRMFALIFLNNCWLNWCSIDVIISNRCLGMLDCRQYSTMALTASSAATVSTGGLCTASAAVSTTFSSLAPSSAGSYEHVSGTAVHINDMPQLRRSRARSFVAKSVKMAVSRVKASGHNFDGFRRREHVRTLTAPATTCSLWLDLISLLAP